MIGESLHSDNLHYGFLYTNGQTLDLGAGIAEAINNAGQVAGNVFLANILSTHAFIYTNGEKIDLGTLGGRNSQATAINNVGQVVGFSDTPLGGIHAFLYTNGQMLDLGTFGANRSYAFAINDAGQVVVNMDYGGNSHPFVLSNGQLIDLGSLGGASGFAYGINNAGQVVGTSDTSPFFGLNHAFLYRDGGLSDLNNLIDPTLGIVLNSAVDINDHGQIVADSYSRGYLLTPLATTPVPEPSTLALLGLALFGLAGSLSFRNKRLP